MQPTAVDKQLSPQKRQQLQQQLASEAAKRGISLQQYVTHLKEEAVRQYQSGTKHDIGDGSNLQVRDGIRQKTEHQVNTGPLKEKAIALAKFLQSQDLKTRICILQEKRKEMFKGNKYSLLSFLFLYIDRIGPCLTIIYS